MASPFEVFQNVEAECLQKAAGLPILDDVKQTWTGIGFRIGDSMLVASMNEVAEILHMPDYTPIPGVRSWMVGLANVRGNLLPLLDLKGFVTGQDVSSRKDSRVLVAKHESGLTGLVVDEILGLKHFYLEEQAFEIPSLADNLRPYIKMAFKHADQHWPVFSFNKLIKQERFLQIAI
ncbi:MAG: purine-binding chemotaxis protein CheW [Gammaproteobacteria bacterium]|nr:purine-binding chemotaxis protein CheW [Gammaproteobacteria bacterium]